MIWAAVCQIASRLSDSKGTLTLSMCRGTSGNLELSHSAQTPGYNGFPTLVFVDFCWAAPCEAAFNSLVTETGSSGHTVPQDKSEASASSNHTAGGLSPAPV